MERVRKSNGNSFSTSNGVSMSNGQALSGSTGVGKPVPTWKFGVSPESFIADRGDM